MAVLTQSLVAYLASRTLAGTGLTLLRATVAWHLYALTHSAFDLGLLGAVQLVPALLLSLPAGVVIDTYARARIIQIAQACQFAAIALLLLVVQQHMLSDAWLVVFLYAVMAFSTACAAFSNPARAALLPQLVGKADFPRVVTFSSSTQALAFALGPAIAGLVLSRAPLFLAYALAAGLVVSSVISLAFVHSPSVAPGHGSLRQRARGMLDGVRYVFGTPILLAAMTLDLFAVILGGAGALLPVFANEILHVGAPGFGWLSAALELGALTTAVVLLFLPPIKRAGLALLVAVAVYGVATIVFGASTWFPLSLVAYALAGMADQVSVVLRQTLIQLETPDELRGRVSAVASIFIGASNQLAAVEAGFVAAATSAPFAVISGGAGVLLVVVAVVFLVKPLRSFVVHTAKAIH